MRYLKVKEVIEKLQKFDPELPACVYAEISEDMDVAHEVEFESNELGNLSYCKGDHILYKNSYEEFKNGVVVIK